MGFGRLNIAARSNDLTVFFSLKFDLEDNTLAAKTCNKTKKEKLEKVILLAIVF